MQRFFAQKWVRISLLHIGIGTLTIAVLAILSRLFGSACPLYAFFDVCCPYCGMTSAHLAALRLDFAAAMEYHPAFFAGLPFLWLLFHKQLFKKKWAHVLWWVLTLALGLILMGTYVARVIIIGGFNFFT